jgi:transposase
MWPGKAATSRAVTKPILEIPVPVRRAYKFRAYPTRPQEGRAVRLLADHCDLYNAALAERREAWRMRHVSISYGVQSAQLKDIRRIDPDGQGRHSFTAQQQTLRRLDAAFKAFYGRCKAAKKDGPGYPRFKPYQRFSQVKFVAADGAKWEPAVARWAYVRFQAVGRVKVKQHRGVPGAVKGLQLKREGRRWYVILTGKAEEAGRQIVRVNPAGTSTICHQCGHRCTRPRQNTVVCPVHGPMDADVNGARNICSRAGLGSGQAAPVA